SIYTYATAWKPAGSQISNGRKLGRDGHLIIKIRVARLRRGSHVRQRRSLDDEKNKTSEEVTSFERGSGKGFASHQENGLKATNRSSPSAVGFCLRPLRNREELNGQKI